MEKSNLAWLCYCKKHHLQTTLEAETSPGWLKEFIFFKQLHGFPETRLVLTLLHTPSSKKKDSIRFLQNRFSNISVTLWKHQHYNSRDELLAERWNILPSMALKYLALGHVAVSYMAVITSFKGEYTVTFKMNWWIIKALRHTPHN